MAGTNYSKFGWWMRTQQRFLVMTDLERRSFARQVNDVHLVYTDWGTIVVNLTHPDMVYIDVRKLSIRSLKECRDWANCVDLNENLRPPGNIPEAEERWYEEEDFNAVINVIINQGIFQKACGCLDSLEESNVELHLCVFPNNNSLNKCYNGKYCDILAAGFGIQTPMTYSMTYTFSCFQHLTNKFATHFTSKLCFSDQNCEKKALLPNSSLLIVHVRDPHVR